MRARAGLLALVLAGAALCPGAQEAGREMVVYYSGSLNGNLEGCECGGDPKAGLGPWLAYLRANRDASSSLLLDTGDLAGVYPRRAYTDAIVGIYGAAGYDLAAVGDQDFTEGALAFLEYAKAMPFAALNLAVCPTPESCLPLPSKPRLFERGGIPVALIALVSPAAFRWSPDDVRRAVKAADPAECLEGTLAIVPAGSLVVLLFHGAVDEAKALCEAFPAIDVAVVGHEQYEIRGERSGGAILVSPGRNGNALGALRLRVDGEGRVLSFSDESRAFAHGDPVDPAVTDALAALKSRARGPAIPGAAPAAVLLAAPPAAPPPSPIQRQVELIYYYAPGCPSCAAFLDETLPSIQSATGAEIRVQALSLDSEASLARYGEVAGASTRLPAALVQGRFYAGDLEIVAALRAAASGSEPPPESPKTASVETVPAESAGTLPLGLVLLAGLADGVNPCVFTAIVFLISSLALAGRRRSELAAVGLCFTLAVFLTYFAVGLGAFGALRAWPGIGTLSRLFVWAMAGVLALMAALSLRDAMILKKGKADGVALKLPGRLSAWIHGLIRGYRGGKRPRTVQALSAFGLGVCVTILELGCTGQVYLPTLALMARSGKGGAEFLLAAYCLAFIFPLCLVFVLSLAGLSSRRLGDWYTKRAFAAKLASAAAFLALAIALAVFG